MPALPTTDDALLVRTTFDDDAAWEAARDAALAENEDGFRAQLTVVDDPDWTDASWQDLREAVVEAEGEASVLFVVDGPALGDDHPVLVVDLDEDRAPFRCVAAHLWSVENNLDLANMDWEEFAAAVDDDGVYRGFPD